MKRILLALAIILCLATAFVAWLVRAHSTNFYLGNGVTITIRRATSWEVSVPYYVKITRGSTVLMSETFLGAVQPDRAYEFGLQHLPPYYLVVDAECPDLILLAYDESSSKAALADDIERFDDLVDLQRIRDLTNRPLTPAGRSGWSPCSR